MQGLQHTFPLEATIPLGHTLHQNWGNSTSWLWRGRRGAEVLGLCGSEQGIDSGTRRTHYTQKKQGRGEGMARYSLCLMRKPAHVSTFPRLSTGKSHQLFPVQVQMPSSADTNSDLIKGDK